MKKLFIITAMIVSSNLFAQISDIKINDQTTVNAIYAGALFTKGAKVDTAKYPNSASFRIGASATYNVTSWFAIKSTGFYQIEDAANTIVNNRFWFKLNPNQKFSFEIGSLSTLPTEQRPDPISGNGHFETWTEGQIIGGGLGAKAKYKSENGFGTGISVVERNRRPEYHLMLTYKGLKISGWYGENKNIGGVVSLEISRLNTALVWKQNQLIANKVVITLGSKKDWAWYYDIGYDLNKKDLPRGESGFLKLFDSKYINGLFGLGYRQESKMIAGYLFVHL